MTTAIAIKMSDTEVARLESILENTGKLVEIGLATACFRSKKPRTLAHKILSVFGE